MKGKEIPKEYSVWNVNEREREIEKKEKKSKLRSKIHISSTFSHQQLNIWRRSVMVQFRAQVQVQVQVWCLIFVRQRGREARMEEEERSEEEEGREGKGREGEKIEGGKRVQWLVKSYVTPFSLRVEVKFLSTPLEHYYEEKKILVFLSKLVPHCIPQTKGYMYIRRRRRMRRRRK